MKHIQFAFPEGPLRDLSKESIAVQSLESVVYMLEQGDPNVTKWAKDAGVIY
jgi:hypothetical protein